MSMFDEIIVQAPHNQMLDERIRNARFQTKDFANAMWDYEVSTEGRLIEHPTHLESLPDEECEYYGTPEWKQGGIYRVMGSMKTIADPVVDLNYHGDVNFYTHLGKWGAPDFEDFEYIARFTDGDLTWIKRITPPSS